VKKKYDDTFLNRSISQVSNNDNHANEIQNINKNQLVSKIEMQ